MDKIAMVKKSVQLQNWAEMAATRQDTGLSVAQWCEQEQISRSVYYYRLRKVRESLCEQIPVAVAQIPPTESASRPVMSIVSGEMRIEIDENASVEAIAAVVRALRC